MHKTMASLSLDLDNKWTYLKTHGESGWEHWPSYFDVVVPRFLEVFRELGLRVTVFVVGQDAALEQNGPALASIVAAGHEIGNHSFAHNPWLHLYSAQDFEEELSEAEQALELSTGARPIGFRGPGYSCSPTVLSSLAHRGYQYDASTLPTFLGPLARTYYFLTARLSREERARRRRLFGGYREGLQPLKPYWWHCDDGRCDDRRRDDGRCDDGRCDDPASGADEPTRLLEIPVTTMPLFRTPIHLSYLLFLRQFSALAAWSYWRLAMTLCRLTATAPSLLLHPLDFMGASDDADLAFFPAMRLEAPVKIAFVRDILADFARRYQVVPMGEYAAAVATQDLPARRIPQPRDAAGLMMAQEIVPR